MCRRGMDYNWHMNRHIASVLQIIMAVVFGVATACLWVALWLIWHEGHLPDWTWSIFDHWQYVVLTYLVVAAPLLLLERAMARAANHGKQSSASAAAENGITGIWLLALVTLGVLLFSHWHALD